RLRQIEQRLLPERPQRVLAHPHVVPPPVHQQQLQQEPELRYRVVRDPSRLQPFLARDPDPHVRLLDHRDVVRPVTHREGNRLVHPLPDRFHQVRFLLRARPAADHRVHEDREVEEALAEEEVVFQR
ncbi:hypothetical protein KEM55_007029, partial [Ascosphaera atra]